MTHRTLRNLASMSLLALACSTGSAADAPEADAAATPEPEKVVELAICLDTSGSMSGLIDSCRQKLWEVVNDLALAKPTPRLRVALVTFGNDGHPADAGWVVTQSDLTDDLDLVSDKMFQLSTNGGTELVGRAVQTATSSLSWTPGDHALRIVIVAGNESADQDEVAPFRGVCKAAVEAGLLVNSIYCGPETDELAPAWREVAKLAEGEFASIDQEQGRMVITTPFDDEIAALGGKVNETYVPFGDRGTWGCENQRRQDANATSNAQAAASRATTKGTALYCNDSWDLVDASEKKDFDWAALETEKLPEALRKKTLAELKAHVAKQLETRRALQKRIGDLSKKRGAHIDAEIARLEKEKGIKAFDFAVRAAVRRQAESRGFSFARP